MLVVVVARGSMHMRHLTNRQKVLLLLLVVVVVVVEAGARAAGVAQWPSGCSTLTIKSHNHTHQMTANGKSTL